MLALVLAGCSVDARVTVRVRDDGSGTVRVAVRADAEAVTAVELGGLPIDDAVRLADLTDIGWSVGTWAKAADGSATLVLAKPFDSVGEVAGIVRELNGDVGPVPSLRASRTYGLVSTDYSVTGRIDLGAAQSGIATDPQIVAALEGLGVDVRVIDEQLRAQVQSSFDLKIVVDLPGARPRTFAPRAGTTSARIDAASSVRNTERLLFLAAAVGFVVLAGVVWSRGGRRRRRRGPRARSGANAAASRSGARQSNPPASPRRPHRPPPDRPRSR